MKATSWIAKLNIYIYHFSKAKNTLICKTNLLTRLFASFFCNDYFLHYFRFLRFDFLIFDFQRIAQKVFQFIKSLRAVIGVIFSKDGEIFRFFIRHIHPLKFVTFSETILALNFCKINMLQVFFILVSYT